MLAQKEDIFEETSKAIYNLNQDDVARYWCQMREEGKRILQTYQNQYQRNLEELAIRWAERGALLIRKVFLLVDGAEKEPVIVEKDLDIAKKNLAIAKEKLTFVDLLTKIDASAVKLQEV